MLGELNTLEIDDILHTQIIGRIGCQVEGKVYVVPITYAFDGENIFGHMSDGLKIQMMRQNPNVCFQTERIVNMKDWQSVIAWGTFEELQGYDARLVMQKFINRLQPLITTEMNDPMHGIEVQHLEGGGQKAIVYRIKLNEKTGRFEKR